MFENSIRQPTTEGKITPKSRTHVPTAGMDGWMDAPLSASHLAGRGPTNYEQVEDERAVGGGGGGGGSACIQTRRQ